jgi:flagellar hook-basal body complex protein FliE
MNPVASIPFPALSHPPALTSHAPGAQPRPISPAELERLLPSATTQAPSSANTPASFDNVLTRLVNEVDARQTAAGDSVRGLLAGENVSLHQAMIASEEAGISFQLMVEIRNKLLESYQEMMRMQI